MRRCRRFLFALVVSLPVTAALAAQDGSAPAPAPGRPAPAQVVAEIQQTLDAAVSRFDAMDLGGVLAYVSEGYRTGTLTKAGIAEQLRVVFAVHDRVRARVRIDDVRLVGDHVWVYSTGDVTGRLRYLGSTIPVASWQRELEIARRENGRWRLFGYQQ